jgi:hypothetical protein
MNVIEVTQVLLVATGAILLGRVGWALTRWLERRLNAPRLTSEAADALQSLEDECARLGQEVSELQERQDFTERALLTDPAPHRVAAPEGYRDRAPTPR